MAIIRGLLASIYIGIQIESNWTKKIFYLIFLLTVSFTAVLAVILIYGILGGGFKTNTFVFAISGSLFYFLLSDIFFNTAWTVVDDREHYRMLKYIIVSKLNYLVYLLGRGMAKEILSLISVGLAFLWVIPIFRLPLNINCSLFLFALLFSFVGAFGLALIFSGYYMLSIRGETTLMDVLFGGFFIISGALFPPNVLPKPIYAISVYFPLTNSIEMLRFSVFGKHLSPFLADISFGQFLLLFVFSNLITLLIGLLIINFSIKRAVKKGFIDITTAF